MAFALSKAYFYKLDTPSHVRKWGFQVAEFHVTREAADVDLDVGDIAGTFWTAVGASGLGVPALAAWKSVIGNVESVVSAQITSDAGVLQPSVGAAALSASGTHSAIWAGGSAGTALAADSVAQTFRYQQNGEFVTLKIPGYQAAAKGAAPGAVIILTAGTVLPAELRPVVDTVVRTRAQNGGAFVAGAGYAVIKTTGQVELYLDGVGTTAYTVTTAAGVDTFSVSYRTAAAPVAAGTFGLSIEGAYPVVKPVVTLPAVASPTALKLVLVLALAPSTRPSEFGV